MSAKVRAESDASSPRASTILLATPFQIAEGVASQNLAISVCSAVRVGTRQRSDGLDFVVVARVSATVERRWSVRPELRAALDYPGRDRTPPGSNAGAGPIGTQMPGAPAPDAYTGTVQRTRRRPVRAARMALAAFSPMPIPGSVAVRPRAARDASRAASSPSDCAGNSATSVSCAAAIAAASDDAPAGAAADDR